MTTKNLAYYLAHDDEMPTDPAELERLTTEHLQAAHEGTKEEVTVDRFVEPEDKPEVAKSAENIIVKEEPAAETLATSEHVVEKPKWNQDDAQSGILGKDGKNIMPYGLLTSARERADTAERFVQQQAQEIEKLRADIRAATAGTPNVAEDPDEAPLGDEDLKAVAEDSPMLGKVIKGYQSREDRRDAYIKTLEEKLEKVIAHVQVQQLDEAAQTKNEMQEALDANPELSAWSVDADSTRYNKAAFYDRVLRQSPEYANVSFADRFAEVVKLTNAALGMPVALQPAAAPTQQQLRATAEAKLKATPLVPRSLSDIPGGAPPAVDERANVESMDVNAFGNKLMKMTREQQEAYLSTL